MPTYDVTMQRKVFTWEETTVEVKANDITQAAYDAITNWAHPGIPYQESDCEVTEITRID